MEVVEAAQGSELPPQRVRRHQRFGPWSLRFPPGKMSAEVGKKLVARSIPRCPLMA
jgi:hypothetical protein